MVKNLPVNTGDPGFNLWSGKIPHASEKLSLWFSCSVMSIYLQPHGLHLSFTISQSLLKLVSIESVMPFNYLILCHPLLLPPSIYPIIRVFSNESALHIRWPKYWRFILCYSNAVDVFLISSINLNARALCMVRSFLIFKQLGFGCAYSPFL